MCFYQINQNKYTAQRYFLDVYMYGVCLLATLKALIKQSFTGRTFCRFSFSQYGCWQSSHAACSTSITAGMPPQSLMLCLFSPPLPHLLRGLLGEDEAASLLFIAGWLTDSDKVVQKGQKATVSDHLRDCLAWSQSLLLCLLVKHFGPPPGWLLWELQILVKNDVNSFSWHIMGPSEFHDTLLLVILHFCGDIGDGSLPGEISPICRHQFLLLCLLIIAYSCIIVKALSW